MKRQSPTAQNPSLARLYMRDTAKTMVPVALLSILAMHIRQRGLDPVAVIPELATALEKPADSRYPAEEYCQMLMRAAEELNDPLFGLHLGQTVNPADLGTLGYMLMSCSNLGEVLMHIQRYHRLINDVTPLMCNVVGQNLELRWGTAHGKMGALYDESGIVTFIEFARRLSGLYLSPQAIAFVNPPPDDPAPYISYFGCPVSWGQAETSLTISLKSLQLPLVRSDKKLLILMENNMDQALTALNSSTMDLGEAVRKVVANLAHHGVPELPEVAYELRLAPRDLYRRLAAQGMTFRTLRQEAMRKLAEDLLARQDMNLEAVSRQLGYTQTSAFVRAFKGWTGFPPMDWQRRHRPRN